MTCAPLGQKVRAVTAELFAYDRNRSWAALVDANGQEATAPSGTATVPGINPAEVHHQGLAIRHILVPLDGSALAECVLPLVTALAKAFSAQITLLRILEAARGPGPAPRVDALDWEITRAEAHTYLSTLAAQIQNVTQRPPAIEILQGKAAEQILHAANAQHADLIALSTHGESGLSDWHVSGTAQKVISGAQHSVLIVPAHQYADQRNIEMEIHKILVPLDCSQRAECILPTVSELARLYDAELILAHIVPEPQLPRRVAPSTADLELAAQLTQRNCTEAQRYLREVRTRLSAEPHRIRVRWRNSAQPAQALNELAEYEKVDLVVVSAHGSSGDAQKRYGGIVEGFVQTAKRPVIIMQDLAGAAGAETNDVPHQVVRPSH